MPSLREAASRLSSSRQQISELSEKLGSFSSIETGATVKEPFLSRGFDSVEPGKVSGVDGGIARERYSAVDVIAVRAVAAVFNYRGGLDAAYIPSKNPEPEFHVLDAGDSESFEARVEEKRLESEVSAALEALDGSTVLMDGSLVPSYSGSGDVAELYSRLLQEAEPGRLAGVVEDSRGLKQASLLEDRLGVEIGEIRDTLLMDAVLEPGERSFVRRYSTSPVEHPVLRDMDDAVVNRLHTFYVKLSGKDLPLRVDYFGDPGDADSLAGLLLSLKASSRYTVPAPIVEADKRAKIPREYLKRLEKRFNPETMRRERRGF